MKKLLFYLLASLFLAVDFGEPTISPCRRVPYASFSKCICQENTEDPGYPQVTCANLYNIDELEAAVANLRRYGQAVSTLIIANSTLIQLNQGMFKELQMRRIRFVNTELLTLEAPGRQNPFDGLEDTLQAIEVIGNYNAQRWNLWPLLSLRKLSLLYFDKCAMSLLSKDKFDQLPENLQSLYIMNGAVHSIEEGAFRKLHLKMLDLSNNPLSYIPPRTLPQGLEILVLENNKFNFFPLEVLEDQPRLTQIDLRHNKIKLLVTQALEKLSQLARRNHYISINLRDNPVQCCSFSRITNQNVLRYIEGTCSLNGGTYNVKIKELSRNQLRSC